jgi:prepilin signal peptidase PulO-like enzyme (type II secretory pathway)
MKRKTLRKESNILLVIALVLYLLLKTINKFIINVADIIYVAVMLIVIGIVISALKTQREGK